MFARSFLRAWATPSQRASAPFGFTTRVISAHQRGMVGGESNLRWPSPKSCSHAQGVYDAEDWEAGAATQQPATNPPWLLHRLQKKKCIKFSELFRVMCRCFHDPALTTDKLLGISSCIGVVKRKRRSNRSVCRPDSKLLLDGHLDIANERVSANS